MSRATHLHSHRAVYSVCKVIGWAITHPHCTGYDCMDYGKMAIMYLGATWVGKVKELVIGLWKTGFTRPRHLMRYLNKPIGNAENKGIN